MTEFKKNYIISEMQKNVKLAWGGGATLEDYIPGKNRKLEHVLYIDEKIGTGDLYSEVVWLMPDDMMDPEYVKKSQEMMARLVKQGKTINDEEMPGPKPHSHPFDELFTFFGTDLNDPDNLCGEVDFFLEEECIRITRSCILYIPAGMRHCPVNFNRMDKPFFHFSMGFTDSYYHKVLINRGGEYAGQTGLSKNLISGDRSSSLRLPSYRKKIRKGLISPITQLNSDILPASKINCETCWIFPESGTGVKEGLNFIDEHVHPFEQVIGFFGSDLNDIHKLHAEVELWVQGKPYKMNKSFCAVIPAGVKHGPLMVRNVKKPVFHYTAGNSGKYE